MKINVSTMVLCMLRLPAFPGSDFARLSVRSVDYSLLATWIVADDDDAIAGYKIYWRETTSPTWDKSRFVGTVEKTTLEGIVIDNYFFGISTVGKNGIESPVVFPNKVMR